MRTRDEQSTIEMLARLADVYDDDFVSYVYNNSTPVGWEGVRNVRNVRVAKPHERRLVEMADRLFVRLINGIIDSFWKILSSNSHFNSHFVFVPQP